MPPATGCSPGFRPGPEDLDEPAAALLRAEAAAVARDADVVVVVLGLGPAEEYEGFDRTHLDLPANQLAALRAVAEANPHVVALVVNGSAVLLDEVRDLAPAVLECWLGGQAAGSGAVDVLTGAVNPSGRLAETVPLRLQDTPSYLSFPGDSSVVTYGEGLFVGYRGFDALDEEVAYPFGYGLSYTSSSCPTWPWRSTGSAERGDLAATVEVTVTNTGAVDGAEVVQVYLRDPQASVTRPVRELAGFAKVASRRASPGGSASTSSSGPSSTGPSVSGAGRSRPASSSSRWAATRAICRCRRASSSTRPRSPRRSVPDRPCTSGWPTPSAARCWPRPPRGAYTTSSPTRTCSW